MNIVVLGGAGHMGRHIAWELIEHTDARVTIADYHLSKAQALARDLGERARGIFVDAGNRDSLLLALRDADVAIGAVGPFYRFAPKMAWAALESHVDYVDICDDHGPVEVLFEFDAVAQNMDVTMITGLGWTPGLSNVLARYAADQLDQIDEIRIAWVGGGGDSEGLAVIKHVLYAINGQVPTYRDGEQIQVPALSEPELVEFPDPLGKIKVFHIGHPEPMTIPRTIPARTVSLKGALTPNWNNRLASMLVRLGLTSSEKRIDRVSRLIHRLESVIAVGGVALSGLRVDVSGTRDDEQVTLTYSAADHMSRLTGIPAAIGATMLVRGEIEKPGLFAPEAIIDPVAFLDALAERGIEVNEEETVTPAVEGEAPTEVEIGALAEPLIEKVPVTAKPPSAKLIEGEVVEVALSLDRDQRVGTEAQMTHSIGKSPSATLREGEVVEVALALDRSSPISTASREQAI